MSIRKTFDENISEVIEILKNIDDGCSHTHFEPLMGHPLAAALAHYGYLGVLAFIFPWSIGF